MTRDEYIAKAKELVAADLKREPEELLVEIAAQALDRDRTSGDVIIMDMIAKFSSLLIVLGHRLDEAQKTVARLTGAVFFLTFVILILTGAQAYFTYLGSPIASPQQ